MQIKIIDFGLAQHYDPSEDLRILFGTPEFVAPEVISYEPVSPKSDMWSIGELTFLFTHTYKYICIWTVRRCRAILNCL